MMAFAAAMALGVRPAAAQSPVQIVRTFQVAGDGIPNTEGSEPWGPIEAADGFLYGTTRYGGATGHGTVYRLDKATGAFTTLASFPFAPRSWATTLAEGIPGTLFGIAIGPPVVSDPYRSTIVRVTLGSNTISPVFEFVAGGPAGSNASSLTRAPGGAFFGVTSSGGAANTGTVFRFDPASSSVTPRATLPRASNGRHYLSSAALTLARDGRFYGTSTDWDLVGELGVVTGGTVFRFDPATDAVEVLYAATTGQVPSGPVVETADGMLYGISIAQVPYVSSTTNVFRFNPATRTMVVIPAFADANLVPSSLVVGPDGAVYVIANEVHVLRLDPATGAVTPLHTFTAAEGRPASPLFLASDGLLYGTTSLGTSRGGAVYRLAVRGTPPALDTDADGLPNDWEVQFGFDPSSAAGDNGPAADPDGDGLTSLQEYQAGTHPRGLVTRHLAEGATGSFFRTRLALVSRFAPATVLFRFLKDDGSIVRHVVHLPVLSRATIVPASLTGLESATFSTIIEADVPIGVERTMTWDGGGYGSATETAILAPSAIWHLAEGSTAGDFNLFYLLENPGDTPVSATIRYLLPPGQTPVEKTYELAPHTRRTVYVDTEGPALASTDVSAVITATAPIVVERAMYRDTPGQPFAAGHASAGVTAPALDWFFAEGATGSFFDEFLLVANPNPSTAEVSVDYLLMGGGTITKAYTVPGNSRFTIWVDDEQIPTGSGQRPLAHTSLSARVRATNGVPVVAERTMWWPGPELTANFWYEAHNSPGATAASARPWWLAEGEQGGNNAAETYILIANTSAFPAQVRLVIFGEAGERDERTYFGIPALSRTTISIGAEFPSFAGRRFGAYVESQGPTPAALVVERAMYSSVNGVLWAAGSNALGTPFP